MDLTQFSDNELSMVIYNDEGLYNMRYRLSRDLLNDMNIFHIDEQWQEFQNDLESEDE